MKKFLLTAVCVATATTMMADGGFCGLIEDFQAVRTSPDGTWIVGIQDSNMTVRNMATGKSYEMTVSEDDWETMYNVGNGYCVANDGTITGGRNWNEAAVWTPTGGELGTWTPLPIQTPETTSTACSITPDGKYIVGSITNPNYLTDPEAIQSIPVIWTRNDDGKYSDPVVLPHPVKDWSGRTPNYCLANGINDEGNIVIGLMTDYGGFACQPFVCTKDDKGDWTMKLLCSNLLNPNNLQLPEYPGESDISDPTFFPEDYMSMEKGDEYMADMAAWRESENPDETTKPDPLNYMNEEEKAKYEEDVAKFKKWEEDFAAYQEVYEQVSSEQTSFSQNLIFLTPDGKHFLATTQKVDPASLGGWMPSYAFSLMIYDLEKDTYVESKSDLSLTAYQINNDLDILAINSNMDTGVQLAYIALKGDLENIQPIQDYYKAKDQKFYDFMEKNMTESVVVGYIETDNDYIPEYADIIVTGIPCGPFDLSWTALSRRSQDGAFQTFIIDYPSDLGVEAIGNNGTFAVKAAGNGGLLVTGEAESIRVYDLSGALVFDGNGTGSIDTGLAEGIYIVKAVATNGVVVTLKATL